MVTVFRVMVGLRKYVLFITLRVPPRRGAIQPIMASNGALWLFIRRSTVVGVIAALEP